MKILFVTLFAAASVIAQDLPPPPPTNKVKLEAVHSPASTPVKTNRAIPVPVSMAAPGAPMPSLLGVPKKPVLPEAREAKQTQVTNAPKLQMHQVLLAWAYPSNQVSADLFFTLSQATNFTPPLTWIKVVSAPAGTFARSFDGNNFIFSLGFAMPAAQSAFVIQASNWWGLGPPNVVAIMPPAPLQITNFQVNHL